MSLAAEGAGAGRSSAPPATLARYQRLAWLTVGGAFLVFCLLCAGGLYAAMGYGEHAYDVNSAVLQVAHGTKLEVQRARQKAWTVVSDRTLLYEDDSVRTGQDTEALITMFDGSTIQLYYSSAVTLKVMRTSRFLNQFKTIELVQQPGSVKAAAAARETYASTKFHVFSEDGRILVILQPSSTALITVPDETANGLRMTVATELGEVAVRDNGPALAIPLGQQRRVFAGDIVLDPPENAETNLIENGDFVQEAEANPPGAQFAPGWRFVQSPPTLQALHVYSDVVTETLGGKISSAARFARGVPSTADLATVDVRQDRDLPVNFYQTLRFQAAVKVAEPSTPVGGLYPLTLRVTYEDVDGNPRAWERSFYAQEAPPPPFDRAATALALIPAGWAELPPPEQSWDLMEQSPRPARVKAVDIIVTGYSFNVYVSGLKLIAR